ncbi:MAG: 3-phosphoshikimate 1-carboxyvinyltransferase [Candidatus Omnitrophica bacterium]|nr:3-phosphoshikimate 1-carboxyvinyltransferase [Candidatus Omnitrophota bacterium]
MAPCAVRPILRLKGRVTFAGDKSIAHRAAILGALSAGVTRIENFPSNKDCLATLSCLKRLGVKINRDGASVKIYGRGLFGLKKPAGALFAAESGTTLRLLMGVLAGQPFTSKLAAARSLSRRPMRRVTLPLRKMGAVIRCKKRLPDLKEEYPPVAVTGTSLRPITYRMPVASAQVKSAILLAGLYAKGETAVIEPFPTRDHTERMMRLFGARLKINKKRIIISGRRNLVSPAKFYVPGDISSAAFFIVAASVIPDSRIFVRNASLNPSRMGIIRTLKRMGAKINIKYQISPAKLSQGRRDPASYEYSGREKGISGEPIGEIEIRSSRLKGVTVKKKDIPSLIDELPVLMVAACFAGGKSVFEGVEELRVKETDRIRSMTENLKKMGADIRTLKAKGSEKIVIRGVTQLKGAEVKSFGDHRTAMSMAVAGLAAKGLTRIDDISCISKSFPGFLSILNTIKA